MSSLRLTIKYALFALVATGINLLFQWPFFFFYEGHAALYSALLVGTLAGLVVKYILDKHWIFYHKTTSHGENAKKFGLYSLMGGVTTFIFWGVEMGFYYFTDMPGGQYLGGAIGLAIGYVTKYFLDKRFVFKGGSK